jgi:hypothetical protein
MGLFRINFSSVGVGISAGIPGFRVGAGPRGNYIQMGAHGIYYRAALPHMARFAPSKAAQRINQGNEAPPLIPDGTLANFQAIESADAATLVDSSSAALLAEIGKKHRQLRSWPLASFATGMCLLLSVTNNLPYWAAGVGVVFGVAVSLLAHRWDLKRKLVVLHYELADLPAKQFAALVDGAAHVASASRKWHIAARADVLDRKYHAGANTSVKRQNASVAATPPPYMASNLDPVTVVLSKSTFYFFPDRILVYSGGHIGAVSYSDLQAAASTTRFIEESGVPSDSTVVDRTWRYVNKKGGPDKRFKDNRELPICTYGEIALKSDSGVNELLMISKPGLESGFVSALRGLSSGRRSTQAAVPAIP